MHADEVFEVLVYLVVFLWLPVPQLTSTGGHFYARIDEVFFDQ